MASNIVLAGAGARKLGGGFVSTILVFVLIYWILGIVRS